MPTASASCIGSRWSGPPGEEPPPTGNEAGFFFQAVIRSSRVLYGESVGTKMAPASSIRRAIGVAAATFASVSFVYAAPTTPRPISSMKLPLPDSVSVRARPTVPPAPARFVTSVPVVTPISSITLTAARPVTS